MRFDRWNEIMEKTVEIRRKGEYLHRKLKEDRGGGGGGGRTTRRRKRK